jgi:hypothetical protein
VSPDANINLTEWWQWYSRILTAFGYDRSKDQLAADVLSRLIAHRAGSLQQLKALLFDQPVLVFGAGPSLEEDVKRVAKENLLKKWAVISADGATTALLKLANVAPRVVVTDLDGDINDLLQADGLGSVLVVHGHGDNINRLRRYVPRLKHVIGTTQVEPRPSVYNFGGFTDGDRAVFLAVAMKAKLVALAGMDIGSTIGRYSKKHVKSVDIDTKIRKLKICKELLEWLASRVDIPLYNVTAKGENIKGFVRLSPSELARVTAA